MRLEDKVVIVTGAAAGMGREIVNNLLKEGAKVAAVDLKFDANVGFNKENKNIIFIETDITDDRKVDNFVQKTKSYFGKIDVLLNVAGTAQRATPIENVTNEEWSRIMSINSTAVFLTCRSVVPIMKEQQSGSIINIASIAAVRPRPGLNAYIASKGATIAFSRAIAIELAEHNIRVNVINPGPSDTKMLSQFASDGENIDEVKNSTFKSSVPLGDLVQPEDIANVSIYLSSNEARMVTGSVFNIDGGRGL